MHDYKVVIHYRNTHSATGYTSAPHTVNAGSHVEAEIAAYELAVSVGADSYEVIGD